MLDIKLIFLSLLLIGCASVKHDNEIFILGCEHGMLIYEYDGHVYKIRENEVKNYEIEYVRDYCTKIYTKVENE